MRLMREHRRVLFPLANRKTMGLNLHRAIDSITSGWVHMLKSMFGAVFQSVVATGSQPEVSGGKRWHLDARERLLFAFPIAGKLSPRLPSGILCANGPQTPRKSDYIHYKGVSAISAPCLSDPIFKRIPKVIDEQNQVNEGVWSQFLWYLSWPTAKRTSSRYPCLSSKARRLGPTTDHLLTRYGVVECTSQWNPRLTGREALARTHMWDFRISKVSTSDGSFYPFGVSVQQNT